jgi:hypothetical protein
VEKWKWEKSEKWGRRKGNWEKGGTGRSGRKREKWKREKGEEVKEKGRIGKRKEEKEIAKTHV